MLFVSSHHQNYIQPLSLFSLTQFPRSGSIPIKTEAKPHQIRCDAHDTIKDWNNRGSTGVLQLGEVIDVVSTSVPSGTNILDVVLDFCKAGSAMIENSLDTANSVIDEVRFADGNRLPRAISVLLGGRSSISI